MFNKILIANRGEIACRIIKTARRMGIETVAIYSTADKDSLHVSLADSALCIGEPEARASYLNIDAIINAAIASHAKAIHPGYGFLSENPAFARACTAAGIVFIGPSVSAMEAMASKQLAKQLLEKSNIPLTPGYHGTDQSDKKLLTEATRLGFPILLKAANGGGGKGMRAVHDEKDFKEALAAARRESLASFADDTMLIEKLILNPRHIEMQIMADNHGHIVHLFERDCSIQRRHQKIIEEAPAPHLSKSLRDALAKAAIAVAKTIDYRGAGTVEFLVDKDMNYYFMEMNTRLQVEHPVTEMITGLDLVEWQLRIAADEILPLTQDKIHMHGHAIECRIYAEDPHNEFIPSIGHMHFLVEPTGDGIRIDSGVHNHSEISRYYDPMIAKLIAWGEDRHQTLQRLEEAFKHYHIGGVKTNIPFLQRIISHPNFVNAVLSTHFLSEQHIEIPLPDSREAILLAAGMDYLSVLKATDDPLYNDTFSWQMHLKGHWNYRCLINGEPQDVLVTPINHHEFAVKFNDETIQLQVDLLENKLTINDGKNQYQALVETFSEQLILYTACGPITVLPFNWNYSTDQSLTMNNTLRSPMPATVVAVLKNIGDTIKAGEAIMVLEAMKMEHTIHAPHDGVLVEIFYNIGTQVDEGAELGRVDEALVR